MKPKSEIPTQEQHLGTEAWPQGSHGSSEPEIEAAGQSGKIKVWVLEGFRGLGFCRILGFRKELRETDSGFRA